MIQYLDCKLYILQNILRHSCIASVCQKPRCKTCTALKTCGVLPWRLRYRSGGASWFMTFELKELEQIAFRLTPLKRSVKNRASDKQRVQTSTPVECQLSYGINWSRRTLGVQNPCRHASLDNSRHLFFVTFCSASKSSFPILNGSDFFHIRYFIFWWLWRWLASRSPLGWDGKTLERKRPRNPPRLLSPWMGLFEHLVIAWRCIGIITHDERGCYVNRITVLQLSITLNFELCYNDSDLKS